MSNEASYNRIVWLASYPKSGNTWFRAFLANLLNNNDQPADINQLEGGPIASSRQLFDEATGLSSSDLTMDETEELRPYVYEHIAREADQILFHKIHDAYTLTLEGIPLVPGKATKGVIYLIRNPLDVAVSFAHHAHTDFETMVNCMADNAYAFCSKPDKLYMQLRQRLLSWSAHVESWTNSGLNIHIIRYEDMMRTPFETFTSAVEFCGLAVPEEKIRKAITLSNFSVLQKQEKEKGFREKAQESKLFFRKGKIGSWKEELPNNLVTKIVTDHARVMKQFGYLNENGQITNFDI